MIINAMIPARMGSTRLRYKNLGLLNKKPMIYYAINAAKESGVFSKVIVNSEDEVFEKIADRYDVLFYQREKHLGSSNTKSDDVVYDFMMKNPGDITVWVNTTSPLQTSEEVTGAVTYFQENDLDTLITVRSEQVHCLYKSEPLNFTEEGQFAQTQDLIPVERFVYSIMMWRNSTFIKNYEKNNAAFFCGKIGYYPISKETSIIVKTQEDFQLVNNILIGREAYGSSEIEYDELVNDE